MLRRDSLFGNLALISGFCALGYQVLYLRHLTTLLGDSLHVHAALLSTFLLGIAAGSRLAHLTHRWLAPVELGAGIYALLLPSLTLALNSQGVFSKVASTPQLTVLITAILVAPAALMIGVGLPLFSGYVKAARAGLGRAFEGIYARYNLGAFLGIILVEGVLVGTLGIRHSLYLLGVLNILVGVSLYLNGSTAIRRPALSRHQFGERILIAVVLASTASALYQMLIFRSLNLVLGPHRSNFAAGLAVILLGLCVGAAVASRSRITFHGALFWVPVVILTQFMLLISPLGLLSDGAIVLTDGLGLAGFLERFGYALIIGFVPMMLIGITLPALMRQERAVAREAGELLWYSGLANACGYLLFVTVLHPYLPGWGILSCISVLALVAAWLGWVSEHGVPRLVPAVALSTMALFLAFMSARTWNDVDFHLAAIRSTIKAGDTTTIYRWGGESASLVSNRQRTFLSYNGHPSIDVEVGGVTNASELLSGVIPALTAPSLDRALVLGLGTGITAGAAARVFKQVEVAEINGAFLMLVPGIARSNLDIHSNPRANIHLIDGRALLSANSDGFDAIINSVPAPTYYSAGKIYTEEFYRQVKSSLRDGGVFSTWISSWDMTESGVLTVFSTLRRVFTHCELRVLRGSYVYATCSDHPLVSRDLDGMNPDPLLLVRLRESLAPFDPGEYLTDILLSGNVFAGEPPEMPMNTDDRPILEFKVMPPRFQVSRGGDPITSSPEYFGIDLGSPTEMSPERFVRRAAVYQRVKPEFFRTYFLPVINSDQHLHHAWTEWANR